MSNTLGWKNHVWGEARWVSRDLWERLPQRVIVDGLAWCAGCRRAVDRGWSHDADCPLGEGKQ